MTLALLCLPAVSAAHAQDASAWAKEDHSAARLVAGATVKTPQAAFLHAGLEFRLEPGWKTYWRYPGDSGAPPTFDFGGSQNVKSVDVRWPAPERFPDGAGGTSIGYMDHVLLPLRVTAADATHPSMLHLKLGYDICGKLCVPAEAQLDLNLIGNGAAEPALAKAELRVPKRTPLGADDGHGLGVLSVHRQTDGTHERVVVELAAPVGAPVDLFVEGPTPEWSLPLPEATGVASGAKRRFSFALDGLPPGAQAQGALLTLTAVSGDDAIEVSAHLD